MQIYFAPLHGVTDLTFREVHSSLFPGVDKYFIPFISPTKGFHLTGKEYRELAPDQHVPHPVPQVLTNDPEAFLLAADYLSDLGYTEVNLNLGCPSGTVTAKHKGAGLLTSPDMLALFLDEIFSRSPIPISIKTRLGWASPQEFHTLLPIFEQHPILELTVHARTRSQFYNGRPFYSFLKEAVSTSRLPIVYNGDMLSTASGLRISGDSFPFHGFMLGRGLVTNPALARVLRGGPQLQAEELRSFHDSLFAAYDSRYSRSVVLGKMREISKYFVCCFDHAEKAYRILRKAASYPVYQDGISRLFDCALKDDPFFQQDYLQPVLDIPFDGQPSV